MAEFNCREGSHGYCDNQMVPMAGSERFESLSAVIASAIRCLNAHLQLMKTIVMITAVLVVFLVFDYSMD